MALKTFTVERVGPPEIFANGKQQCKISIEIRRGNDKPLTDDEIDSITLRPYSEQLFPPMKAGWKCAKKANGFDQVLPLVTSVAKGKNSKNEATTVVERYLSFDGSAAGASLEPVKFMGCVKLDNGNRFSTHFAQGADQKDSSETISPVKPRPLHASDLGDCKIDTVLTSGSSTLKLFYWMLPKGVTISSDAVVVTGGPFTEKFAGFYSHRQIVLTVNDDYFFFAAMRAGVDNFSRQDVNYFVARTGNIAFDFDPVTPKAGNDKLRVVQVKLAWAKHEEQANIDLPLRWTITDNVGTDSTFILKADGFDKLKLTDS